jgi:hypothetical protein
MTEPTHVVVPVPLAQRIAKVLSAPEFSLPYYVVTPLISGLAACEPHTPEAEEADSNA